MKIENMQLAQDARGGETEVLATFNASVAGIRLNHCAIIRKPDGFVTAFAPQGKTYARAVTFVDSEMHAAFREVAVAAYEAVGEETEAAGLLRTLRAEVIEMVG